ncbi:Tyrosinase ustQ [Fulvia fulva]|uniref:Tyrosinase ustQ n=1 Tax=Passalora fulva TaxID=5499 RepID=A0A9Q8LKP3_PASFU|nr:Tyrosinase ustQ [Fulvia fulva]KAK4622203.1 Tyrosinase ustQ [Fulvia fulva]KAK4623149.1 Tyrosinase ustQ [Fulvia fulva]UJO18533.1 Tyrosinase ustQ [Fulvia fulva]WPV15922.1 Tyrosinase ustQ [Fulvia fulva]WPV31083.1 Tyrosinase ustQ [Fulvia fulva]
MWPFKKEQEYHVVAGEDVSPISEPESVVSAAPSEKRVAKGHIAGYVTGVVVAIAVAAIAIILVLTIFRTLFAPTPIADDIDDGKCRRRHEWRTLSATQQQDYISAVRCLQSTPSPFLKRNGTTAYDDFPWLHSHVGYSTHHSAAFLPWHRYFLAIYEMALREACRYNGGLVYWDWTLDSHALEKSPVFDASSGFGGDGEVGAEITVGRTGRCVVDGPFAHTRVNYYDIKYAPHCLSRGFRNIAGELGHIDGKDVSPQSVEEVLSAGTYDKFVKLMESRVHDVIPFGIAGDFETFSAPYDPLFFLHHTQLDRLWWLWQQRSPERFLWAYGGHKSRHTMGLASLEDDLEYRGLADDVKVKDVMNTETGVLCYRY